MGREYLLELTPYRWGGAVGGRHDFNRFDRNRGGNDFQYLCDIQEARREI